MSSEETIRKLKSACCFDYSEAEAVTAEEKRQEIEALRHALLGSHRASLLGFIAITLGDLNCHERDLINVIADLCRLDITDTATVFACLIRGKR